jgi:putative DNA methylase
LKLRKKLIEVALPLDAINKASAREKSIRHGHPSTLHLWWARRPLAAARAVIFAQMVDDPSSHPELFPTEEAQEEERQHLFGILEELVQWESTNNEEILGKAREEIWKSWRSTCADNQDHPRAHELFNPEKLPAFHDPFAGGGSLPLEAQRLGLEAYASDLNPVAVLINKAMIEIPPRFAGRPPVNPESRRLQLLGASASPAWRGAQGLAEDVRYYGRWMREEAEKRIGHLYPKVEITEEMAKERPDLKPYIGKLLTVIAWLWARTVKSPNPAFAHVDVPLVSTFMLSTKEGKKSYVEPVVEGDRYRFTVRVGEPKNLESAKNGTKLRRGANFWCLLSEAPIPGDYIKAEAQSGRMGTRLMAMVTESDRGRMYIPPTTEMEVLARKAEPNWRPDVEFFQQALGFRIGNYGMTRWSDLFTPRQLVALNTFSDLIQEAREQVSSDMLAAEPVCHGGDFDVDEQNLYSDAVAVYLAFSLSKLADRGSTICTWFTERDSTRNTFARQSIPMTWDFAELNTLLEGTGSFCGAVEWTAESLEGVAVGDGGNLGLAVQLDAAAQNLSKDKVVSTDPPYYDNIGYADLSDFFYVWLRRSLKDVYPDLLATVAVPKSGELVATPFRHGGKQKAEAFFLEAMTRAMCQLTEQACPTFPVTVYYAFKQAETDDDEGTSSTGWETFLESLISAGFAISGTWPLRTELGNRMRGMASNALASSIVLVCRPRMQRAASTTRRELLAALKAELPSAVARLQRSNIAPVDLAQAAIGPGMAVYTRFTKVIDAKGEQISVRESLALINQTLDEVLSEQEGDFDADTRWALAWFEQSGFGDGEYGMAETLSKAKNTSVAGMVTAGIAASKAGKVRLLRPEELPKDWDPLRDERLTVWEMVHQLIRVLEHGGESAAAELVAKLGSKAEVARELAYRLFTVCERKKRAQEALSYNSLVQSWPEITRLAREGGVSEPPQKELF